jgi:hypothetical protein
MGWLQDYNGAETTWVHVVLLILILGGVGLLLFFANPNPDIISETPE